MKYIYIFINGNVTKANESFDNGVFFDIEAKRTPSVPLTFSFAQLAKGKKLGRSKPATKSQIQALQHTVRIIFTISKPY